jgi:hypothetical protein
MRTAGRFVLLGGLGAIMLVTILAVSARGGAGSRSTVRASTATPRLAPTATPVGPMTYSARDFSIVYPGAWVAVPGQAPAGAQGARVSIVIPDQANDHEVLQILELYPNPQDTLPSLCTGLGSPTTLAGLPMYYQTVVGATVRLWTYVDSSKHTYNLWAFDLGPGSTPQDRQRDDRVLATFKVRDSTPGC